MPKERLEFEQSVDGLFRGALAAHEDLPLSALLRAAGLDLTRKLAPAYKAEDFYRWVKLAARHRFPDVDEAEACRQVGRLAVQRGLQSTFIGRAVLAGLKILGTRRSLLKIGRSFKSGNNYIEAKVTELGPTALEIELGPLTGPDAYFQGILEEGPRLLGAREVRCELARSEGEHRAFRIDWKE